MDDKEGGEGGSGISVLMVRHDDYFRITVTQQKRHTRARFLLEQYTKSLKKKKAFSRIRVSTFALNDIFLII